MNKEFITGILFGFLAPFLILFLISIIIPPPTPPIGIALESAKSSSCKMLLTIGCNSINSTSITVKYFDANKDGKIGSDDTLFELCKSYYGVETDLDCKTKVCGCNI